MLAIRRGFTLIEVLVTLVILMFGLLGIVGLMAKGQKASYEAYQRQMALSLASDMAERILSNRSQVADYVAAGTPPGHSIGTDGTRYTSLINGSLTPNCSTITPPAVCSAAELAVYDLAVWEGMLQGYGERNAASPNPIGSILGARGCIEQVVAPAACPAPGPNPPFVSTTYRISVAWQGNENLGNVNYPSRCGEGFYDITVGQRRVVSLDFLIFQSCCPTC